MATTGLEVRMRADSRGLARVSRFSRTLHDLTAMLDDIDHAYLRRGSRPVWGIADLAKHNDVLVVRVEPRHPPARSQRVDLQASVDALVVGAKQLAETPELPRYFAAQTAERMAHLAEPGAGVRDVTLAAYNGSVSAPVSLTDEVAKNARRAVRPAQVSLGSVSGYLEALGRTRSRFTPVAIVGEGGRRVVTGMAPIEMQDALRGMWRHRVLVSGQLKRNDSGQVVTIDIDEMQLMPEGNDGSATLGSLLGAAPGFVGGRNVDEYVRELRGA